MNKKYAIAIIAFVALVSISIIIQDTDITGFATGEINQPPVYTGTSFETPANTPLTIDLAQYFGDPEGEPITFIASEEDVITVSIEGSIATFTPAPDFAGERTLSIIVTDGTNVVRTPVRLYVSASESTQQETPSPPVEQQAAQQQAPPPPPPEEPSGGGFGSQSFSTSDLVNGCAVINESTSMTANVQAPASVQCFVINASNLFFNCSGFSINGSDGTGSGINITNQTEVTIQDCFIENFSINIILNRTNNSVIKSVTARNSSAQSIELLNSNNNLIVNTTGQSNTNVGINITGGTNNTLENANGSSVSSSGISVNGNPQGANLTNSTGSSTTSSGISISFAVHSTFTNILGISSSGVGINVFNSLNGNNTITDSRGVGVSGDGIQISDSNNITLINTEARSSSGFGITLTSGGNDNNFTNLTASSDLNAGIALSGSASNNTFINTTIFTNNTWLFTGTSFQDADNVFNNTLFEGANGSIRILPNSTIPPGANVTIGRLNISFNNAFLNSTNLSFFNVSSQIRLNNVTFLDPTPTIDLDDDGNFENCPASICTEDSFANNVFVFNVTQFTTYSSTELNLTGCAVVNTSATLLQNIQATNNCFIINASNVFFNCSGFSINGSALGAGINVTDQTNVLIQDCFVENFSINILFNGTDNSTIKNVTARNSSMQSIELLNSDNNLIVNTTSQSNANAGINITGGTNNTLENANGSSVSGIGISVNGFSQGTNLTNSTGSSTSSSGISINSAQHGVSTNILGISSSAVGIAVANSGNGNNTIRDSRGVSTSGDGLSIADNFNITVINTEARSTTRIGLRISATQNNLTNVTASSDASAAIFLNGNTVHNNTFINTTIFTNNTWLSATANVPNADNVFNNTLFKNASGSIRIPSNFTMSAGGNVTIGRLNISFNNAFMNSTNLTYLNISGQITLNGITFTDPKPRIDFEDDGTFVDCPGSICTEDSFANNVFVYNVTQFTGYSSGETGCTTITENTTLAGNLSSNTSCITISASNIFLNCSGFTIFHDAFGIPDSFGIYVDYQEDVIIQDCNIIDVSTNGSVSTGILLNGTNHSIIINNNITTNGSSAAVTGIILSNASTNNTVVNNTFTNNNGTGQAMLIRSQESTSNRIIDNNITMNSSAINSVSGILFSMNNTLIAGNHFRLESGAGLNPFGIELGGDLGGHGSIIENNTIIMFGAQIRPIVYILTGGAKNTRISNNTVSVLNRGTFANKIIDTGSTNGLNHTIVNNRLTMNSTVGQAFGIDTNAGNSLYANNTITLHAVTSVNIGLALDAGAENNTFINNTFIISGRTSIGISIDNDARNNTFNLTTISINGTTASFGVVVEITNFTRFFDTIINTTGDAGWINTTDNLQANFTNTTFRSPNGSIRIPELVPFNGSHIVDQARLNITQNNAFLNGTNLTFLNLSGQITLNGITSIDPAPTIDFEDDGTFVDCPGSICSEVSFANNVYVYDVTQFTSYSSNETLLTGCATINRSRTMTQNITGNDTCITINNNNLTFDCAGFSIFYNANGSDSEFGILAEGRTNITIRDCIIRDINSSGSFGIGINFTIVNDSTINNNSIFTNGTNHSKGIVLDDGAESNVVANNTIAARGSSWFNVGILLNSSTMFNIVTQNNITTNGTSDNYGISLVAASENNVTSNTITTSGSVGVNFGISLTSSSSNNTIASNTISTNGSGSGNIGIRVTLSSENNIVSNRIMSNGSSSANEGINVLISSLNNISGNDITTDGTLDNFGISLVTGTSGIISMNNISTTGTSATGRNHGLRFGTSSNNNNVSSNNIITRGPPSFGIFITSSNGTLFNNTLLNNTVEWISADANTQNNFTNTTFEMPNGSIIILPLVQINGSQNVTKSKLNITQNNAFLNSTNLTFLNTSAQITLNGITVNDPKPRVDFDNDGTFVDCPSSICTEVSFINNVYIFNVTQFTSYSSNDTPIINFTNLTITKTDNPDPVNAGEQLNYTINVTVNGIANGTAFNITVNETYPDQVIFDSAVPAPVPGTNNTFILGNLSVNTSVLINITVNVSSIVFNNTVLNNTVNTTFQNETGGTGRVDTLETTTVLNSNTIINSNLTNCTVVNSTVINSNKENCTIINSTIIDSTNTNATIINSTETNSTDTNTIVDMSIIIDSIKIDSTINNSNVTNSNVTNCTVVDSTVINSDKDNCTITISTIIDSTNTNVTIINSTETNSTDTNTIVDMSIIIDSIKIDSTINNSNVTNSNITNGTLTNDTITNSTIIDSTLTNCTVINSTVDDTDDSNCFFGNTTVNGSAVAAAAVGQGGGGGGRRGIDIRAPAVEAPAQIECLENWACEGWSTCAGGQQTRVCVDINDCGTSQLIPVLERPCEAAEAPALITQQLSLRKITPSIDLFNIPLWPLLFVILGILILTVGYWQVSRPKHHALPKTKPQKIPAMPIKPQKAPMRSLKELPAMPTKPLKKLPPLPEEEPLPEHISLKTLKIKLPVIKEKPHKRFLRIPAFKKEGGKVERPTIETSSKFYRNLSKVEAALDRLEGKTKKAKRGGKRA